MFTGTLPKIFFQSVLYTVFDNDRNLIYKSTFRCALVVHDYIFFIFFYSLGLLLFIKAIFNLSLLFKEALFLVGCCINVEMLNFVEDMPYLWIFKQLFN